MSLPPVALFIFNRPECIPPTLAALRAARPPALFVVADGPRPNQPADVDACAAARHAVEQAIDWPCDVRRDYAACNLGLAKRVSSGISWVFTQCEEAIVLEDDCVADPTFFRFCGELLQRYRDEPRVGQIAGCSFQDRKPAAGPSYYFSRYPHCWGWATWRRAWQHYDHAMHGWVGDADRSWLARWIQHPAERAIWTDRFDRTASGQIDSWAFRWTLALWRKGALTALPYENLVSNIGFGGHGTHTRRATAAADRPRHAMAFPLTHPSGLERDEAADEHTGELLFRPASLATRVRRRLTAMWSP